MNLLQYVSADNAAELDLMFTEKISRSYVMEEMLHARSCEAGHSQFQNFLKTRTDFTSSARKAST